MLRRRRSQKAKEVVVAAASELRTIWTETDTDDDRRLFQERMNRWRARYVREFRQHVSDRDAAQLAEMRIEPDFYMGGGGNPYRFIDDLGVFLRALAADIDTHPADYNRPRPKARGVPRAGGGGLTMPEKVTWAWLREHVPVSIWVTALLALLTLVVLAFWLGHVTPESSWLIQFLKASR